ncbi:hypothetical protein I4Z71_004987, partial [Salmonella enterica subsp. enterica serovar Grumpensis]|nr:hypothetical protein [Salmonella enterica subsp. enterica serovar Grumpensis]
EGSFLSSRLGYGINGGHLSADSLSEVINGTVGQMSSLSLSDYKGVPPDKLKITPADIEKYRKHNAVLPDSYSFFHSHDQWDSSFGFPAKPDGDYDDSMHRPSFNPPAPDDDFKP